jgi:hypothetical protein
MAVAEDSAEPDSAQSKDFYVYAWLRPCGTPFYIGKGKGGRDLMPRGRNQIFNRIVAKLERGGFEPRVERLHVDLSEREAFELERALIAKYGRLNAKTGVLANMTDGGEGNSGLIVSDETRIRIGLKSLGRKAFLGRRHSDAAREKIRMARTGTTATIETRMKHSIQRLRRFSDPAERIKLSLAQKRRFSRPGEREKVSASLFKTGAIEIIRQCAKRRSADPEWQKRMRALNSTPMARKKNRDAQLAAPPTAKSGFKGIQKMGKWWRPVVTMEDGTRKQLGAFRTPEDAARIYDLHVYAISNDAWLNFPDRINSDWKPVPLTREEITSQLARGLSQPTRSKYGFKGVSKSHKKWAANIYDGGRLRYLGSFETAQLAALAYDDEARKLSADAWLNFPNKGR